MSYQVSKSIGNFAEDYVKEILNDAGIPTQKNSSTSRSELIGWDLEARVRGIRVKLEIKYDKMAAKTGNIAIEYFNVKQGKPSGIDATTADLWVYVFSEPKSAWICRTDDLRAYMKNNREFRNIACGGDDNAAMKLYRKESLLDAVFHRLDILSPDQTEVTLANILYQLGETNGQVK